MNVFSTILIALIAAGIGFAACYLWTRSQMAALKSAQAEALAAKGTELAKAKLEGERALAAKAAELEAAQGLVAEHEARIAALEAEAAALRAELEGARIAGELDQFSDFQLLGMCDVFDAEESEGALRRPYGDPAMEQLMNLEVVDFEMPHDGGRDKTPLWTLKPFWRRFTKERRAEMDARTEPLRARREAKQRPL